MDAESVTALLLLLLLLFNREPFNLKLKLF